MFPQKLSFIENFSEVGPSHHRSVSNQSKQQMSHALLQGRKKSGLPLRCISDSLGQESALSVFPTIPLIHSILREIKLDRAQAILIALAWA